MRSELVIAKAALHIVEAIKQNNYKDNIENHLNFKNATEDEAINTVAWYVLHRNIMPQVIEIAQGLYDIHE